MKIYDCFANEYKEIELKEWMEFYGYTTQTAIDVCMSSIENLNEDLMGYEHYLSEELARGDSTSYTKAKIKECELCIANWYTIKAEIESTTTDQAFSRHCDMIILLAEFAKREGYFPDEWYSNLKMMEEYKLDLISNETFDRFVESTIHYYSK